MSSNLKVVIIVAMDKHNGIGKDNDLMWDLPEDMKFFKTTTLDNIVVMGRKNYESIPEKYRPLPNRENVVLTRNKSFEAPDCKVFHTFDDILNHYSNEEDKTMFIIGGGEIYKLALDMDLVDEMYITHVSSSYDADTFFPEINLKDWRRKKIITHPADAKHNVGFEIWKYEILTSYQS